MREMSHETTHTMRALLAVAVVICAYLFAASPASAATITVNSLADTAANDGECTLREAITAANSNMASGAAPGECAAGSGDDSIDIGVTGTVNLTGELPSLSSNMEIEGPGADQLTVRRGTGGEYRIFLATRDSEIAISGITISNGNANAGGAILNSSGTLSISDSTVSGNTAIVGGAINSSFGALTTLTGSTVSGNTATRESGGIENLSATTTITDSTISGNTAPESGGIENSSGAVTITNSTVSGNTATDGDGGGGVGNRGTLTVTNSTISGNTSSFRGGGILNRETLTVTNSTISGNGSRSSGGGISNIGSTATLGNTIVANSTSGGNCGGTITDAGGNLDDGSSCAFAAASSQSNAEDGLDPAGLKDNGGPTRTIALLSPSDAIDAGVEATCAAPPVNNLDQRGVSRPKDGDGDGTARCDIGAFERDPAIVRFSDATYTVGEAADTATITVTRSGRTNHEITVDYATSDGTAAAGSDYTASSGRLTFAAGDDSETFTVPIAEDATDENNETVNLALTNAGGDAVLGEPDEATLTITDNDAEPSLSIDDDTVAEVNSGTTDASFTVTLSAASAKTVTANYTTADDSATAPDDYTQKSGTLTFDPGETEQEITVPVNGDRLDEDDETFFVDLTGASDATISDDDRGIGTITDDDTAGITVTPTSGLTTTEAGGTATFTVVLDSQPTSDVTIPLTSSDATEGTVSPASLNFTPQNFGTPQTVTLTGVDDNADDGDVAYTIRTGAATSADADYSGLDADDVSATNTDDDLPDTTEPTITDLSPPPGGNPDRQNRDLKATVTDDRSDLQKADMRLWVDGKERTDFSYDPRDDQLVFDKMDRFGRGKHSAKIAATDETGNTATRRWTFKFR